MCSIYSYLADHIDIVYLVGGMPTPLKDISQLE